MKRDFTDRQLTVLFVALMLVSSVFGLCGLLVGRTLYGRKLNCHKP